MNMNQGYLKKLLKLGAIQWEFKTFSNTNTKWSVDLMDRKVEGTYLSKEETVSAVERLINEGYVAEEIIIVTNEKNESELEDLTIVEVDAVDPNEGLSLWEKLKETFSFGRYNSDEPSNPLEDYGIEEDPGDHYTEALEKGEIVILVNSAGPTKPHRLSRVTEDVLKGTDEVNDETVAIKNPTEVSIKEEMEPTPGEGEQFDPTKAQSSREDTEGDAVTASDTQPSTSEKKISPTDEAAPELTGDESTVVAENQEHAYPDNISKGVIDGGNSSSKAAHINGTGKLDETKPEQNAKQPESDAYYSDGYEEAGGKSIQQDEEENK